MPRSITIARFDRVTDNLAKPDTLSWEQLAELLTLHQERTTKDGPLWSPALYGAARRRGLVNVLAVSCLVLDFDAGLLPAVERWERWEYVLHTTFSHTPADPHWRAVFPLSADVLAPDWPATWERLAGYFGGNSTDRSCKDASRIYYLPACLPGAPRTAIRHEGAWLNPRPGKKEPPRRPTIEVLVARAREHLPEGRNNAGVWLACQLRDNGYSQAEAEAVRWELEVPREKVLPDGRVDVYDGDEWHETARKVYARPAREPWTVSPNGHHRATTETTESPKEPVPAESLHYTDLGNGRRLVMRHGHNLRHSTTHGWLIWDGRRWKRDDTDEIRRLAADTVRALYGEAGTLPDGQREDAAKWAISCESMFRLRAMIDAASFQEEIAISPSALDANPWLIPCLNGTLNLQTAVLGTPERSDLITRLCPVEYDAEALCSEFDTFLETIFGGDEALVEFIWRAIGYSLTGDVSEQLLFFLHGGGSNGKSTLLNVLLALLGEYGTTAAPGLLTEQRNDQHPTAIADLAGRRLVVCVETGEGKRLAEEQVKQITSSEPLKARFMRKDFFEFLPTHKLWLAANHRPMVRGTDLAIWRRIPLVPFLVEFKGAEEAGPEDHVKDPALFGRLRTELPGILARAVQGCLDWQRDGLLWPACVKAASGAYRAEMDVLAAWLSECCTTGDPALTRQRSGELYASYKLWCEAGGERYMSQTAFGKKLTERGFGQHATPTRYRTGIKLLPIE